MSEHIEELIPLYALGALNEEDSARVEAHLKTNTEMEALFDEACYTVSALAYDADPVDPSPQVKIAIFNTINPAPQPQPSTSPSSKPGRVRDVPPFDLGARWRLFGPALGALGVILAIIAGVWIFILNQQVTELQTNVAVLKEEVASLPQEVMALYTEIETLKEQNADLKQAVTNQQELITTLGIDLSLLQDTTGSLTEQLSGQSQSLTSIGTQLSSLTTEEDRLSFLEEEITARNELLTALEDELNRLQAENNILIRELSSQREVVAHATSPNVQTMIIVGTEDLPGAKGQLIANPTSNVGVLIVVGLPPIEKGLVYRFWLVEEGIPIPTGTINVDERGLGTLIVNSDAELSSFDGMGVSVEPVEENPEPTNEMILLGTFSS
ncbi:MAG: anti-sigma factor [Chloroflexota bacterium]